MYCIEQLLIIGAFWGCAALSTISMPARRLEDRIRELCCRVLYTTGADWSAAVYELQAAIQEHSLRVSNLTIAATVAGQPQMIRERRNS